MYGCESWTLRKNEEARLEAFEKARKLAYYGHPMRKQGNCLEKEIMQGTTVTLVTLVTDIRHTRHRHSSPTPTPASLVKLKNNIH